jgi:hypothetical protein
MRALILEDNRDRQAAMNDRLADRFSSLQVVFFDSAEEMIKSMTADALDDVVIIALDHDLDMLPGPDGNWINPGTGIDVASWLSQRPRSVCPVVVHTTNAQGARGMTQILEEAGWTVLRVAPHDGLEWIYEDWFPAMRNAIMESAPVRSSFPVAEIDDVANQSSSVRLGSGPL